MAKNGVCAKCHGTRKVTVSGLRNGKPYRKKLACPVCVCRCFLGEPCMVHGSNPVKR